MSSEDVTRVQNVLEGMPGYLAILRTLYKEKDVPLRQILDASSGIESLLEIQWNASAVESNPLWKRIMAIVAYSSSPLDLNSMAEMLGDQESEIRHCLFN